MLIFARFDSTMPPLDIFSFSDRLIICLFVFFKLVIETRATQLQAKKSLRTLIGPATALIDWSNNCGFGFTGLSRNLL